MININICIHDWKSYNEGNANWKWFNLPTQATEIENHIDELATNGLDEPFICDTDGWNDTITEHTSINKLMKALLDLENYDKYVLLEQYHDQSNYENYIYELDNETLQMLFTDDLENFANRIHFGEYNPSHYYFYLDGYGNIVTIDEDTRDEYEKSYIREIIEWKINE